jgi:ABC-type transport system involved in cytochrome bd biosynthesis fused ATPase/permease subunit
MAGDPGRIVWWILASRRPATGGQLRALAVLLGLVLLGAFAFAWPWLSEEVPRAIGTQLAQVQALLAEWLRLLTDWLRSLADWLRSLMARLPRFN